MSNNGKRSDARNSPSSARRKVSITMMTVCTAAAAALIALAAVTTGPRVRGFIGPMPLASQKHTTERVVQAVPLFRAMLLADAAALLAGPWLGVWLGRMHRDEGGKVDALPPTPQPMRPGEMVALAGIVALAAVMRLYGSAVGLEYDEAHTLIYFASLPLRQIPVSYFVPNNHILYTILAKLSLQWKGLPMELALRLPSVVCGGASVLAIAVLLRRIYGKGWALAGAAVTAIWPWHLWLSQAGRAYAMVILLATISTTVLHGRGRRWRFHYICATVAMLWAHPYSIFVPLGHLLAVGLLALRDRAYSQTLRKLAGTMVIIALAAGTLYALLIPQMLEYIRTSATQPQMVHWTHQQILARFWRETTFWRHVPALSIAVLLGSTAGLAMMVAERTTRLPALLLTMPVALAVIATAVSGTFVYTHFFAFGMPALLVGLLGFWRWFDKRLLKPSAEKYGRVIRTGVTAAAAMLILAGATQAIADMWWLYGRQPLDRAAQWLSRHNRQTRPVGVAGLACFELASVYGPRDPQGRMLWERLYDSQRIRLFARRNKRCYLVLTFPEHMARTDPQQLALINSLFEPIHELQGLIADGKVVIFRRRNRQKNAGPTVTTDPQRLYNKKPGFSGVGFDSAKLA